MRRWRVEGCHVGKRRGAAETEKAELPDSTVAATQIEPSS
jgi:hypothetical protein